MEKRIPNIKELAKPKPDPDKNKIPTTPRQCKTTKSE
jgi:hypothetical protein